MVSIARRVNIIILPNPRLELELIQPHMAQKPVLRGEVGCACVAREVSVETGGMGERGCAIPRLPHAFVLGLGARKRYGPRPQAIEKSGHCATPLNTG